MSTGFALERSRSVRVLAVAARDAGVSENVRVAVTACEAAVGVAGVAVDVDVAVAETVEEKKTRGMLLVGGGPLRRRVERPS